MKIFAASSEAAMVAAFLEAELGSARYAHLVAPRIAAAGRRPDVVLAPDLADEEANAFRAALLDGRGYRDRTHLFRGFPANVAWHRATLEQADLDSLRYGNWPDWVRMSGGTRRVRDGATRLPPEILPHVRGTRERLASGERMAPILLVGESLQATQFVLLEGHVSATAFLLAGAPSLDALLGVSPDIARWVAF